MLVSCYTTAPDLKRCKRCGTTKQRYDFLGDDNSKDGLKSCCRECTWGPSQVTRKRCGKCGKTKGGVEFSKDKSKPDGLQSWCSRCRRAYLRDRRDRLRASPDRP